MAGLNSGCSCSESYKELLENAAGCPAVIHEIVCIQAAVTITPDVKAGVIESFCVGGPIIGGCSGILAESCIFKVSQNICAQIPLTFSALAAAVPTGIICGTPLSGACPEISGCTLSIGYFQANPNFTNSLILKTGGSIVLGVGNNGASYTVTTLNANSVLSFATPSPPAPSSQPFAQQYRLLYAQLLAANLNVINGVTCDNATIAIANANNFIATSPSGVGKAGAPLVQKPLEEFNTGTAFGCPTHCP